MPEEIKVEKTAEGIEVAPREETKKARAMWGMARTQIANLVKGVTKGYSHTLEIHGVGFRAALKGKDRCSCRSASATTSIHTIPTGVEVKVAGAKQEIIRSPASTSSSSGRSLPTSAPRARPSPTRARASATRASISSARKARRSEDAAMLHKLDQFDRRKRARAPLARQGAAGGRPRLSVFRSSKHIYAQVIDDAKGADGGCGLDAWRRS